MRIDLLAILFLSVVAFPLAGCVEAPPGPGMTADEDAPAYDEDLSDAPPAYEPDLDEVVRDGEPTGWDPDDRVSDRADQTEPINLEALKEGEPVAGGDLNKFFPDQDKLDADGFDLVFKQEKEGIAIASLQKDDVDLAQLSITDLRSNPSAAEKYTAVRDRLSGYPKVSIGSKGTAVLVAGRYQVQVREREGLAPRERSLMLERFDLSGLSKLDQ